MFHLIVAFVSVKNWRIWDGWPVSILNLTKLQVGYNFAFFCYNVSETVDYGGLGASDLLVHDLTVLKNYLANNKRNFLWLNVA